MTERKIRKKIPSEIYQKVLNEFNHRCAKCGADGPHVHHIDENPSNNDLMNLIPLCPNCHLVDEHNPTRKIDPEKLRLLRLYKDPTILKPQFNPLFARLQFFNFIDEYHSRDELQKEVTDLIDFVASLKMGDFYSKKLATILPQKYTRILTSIGNDAQEREKEQEYKTKLKETREQVISLVIELLCYQSW